MMIAEQKAKKSRRKKIPLDDFFIAHPTLENELADLSLQFSEQVRKKIMSEPNVEVVVRVSFEFSSKEN